MARLLTLPSGPRAKYVVAAVVVLVSFVLAGAFAGKFEQAQQNETASFLPGDAESVRALEQFQRLNGSELAGAVVVYRRDGGLQAQDLQKVRADRAAINGDLPPSTLPAPEPVVSQRRDAALLVPQVRSNGDGDEFKAAVDRIREVAHRGTPSGLDVQVTGAAGFGADAIEVFSNIDGALLGVTALVVLICLIAVYRSPVFWLIPMVTLGLAEASSRGAGYLLTQVGVTVNGQSGGILPVLVFGAGTDYALLLVARYREELRRHDDKHEAMREALRRAGPAVVASGLTVVAALLTLTLADVNGTAGLGPIGAMGVLLAMVFMLTLLPALLTVFGRRAFWPRVPHVGDEAADELHGTWRRVGERVAGSPRRVWAGAAVLLLVCTLGWLKLDTGLTNGNSFRGDVEAVKGQKLLERSFPAGANVPTTLVGPDAASVGRAARALAVRRDLVAAVTPVKAGRGGAVADVLLRADPYSTAAFGQVPELRRIAKRAGGEAVLVGGPTAESADYRTSAARDNRVILPIALVVVFLILAGLLRALVAPLLLIGTVILSFAAALGVGIFVFDVVFGFPGIDPSLPLLAFVFLVALGIDYNIFLMARTREEALKHGTRAGMLRGLAVTGGVITSAGIVLAGTFSALAVLPLVFLTEIGFVIAFGVLLDTFLVRSVLVPALVFDVGRRVWAPSALARRDGVEGPPRG